MLVSDERIPIIPYSNFGDPDCCGCLFGVSQGDLAEIVCNECQVVVCTIPASDLQRRLDEMELEGDGASAMCPHCRATHLAPGFSMLMAFICENCGNAVQLSDGPVKSLTTRDELTMAKLESWLSDGAKSPNEQLMTNRLREISGIVRRNKVVFRETSLS